MGALALLVFLSALAGVVARPVGEARQQSLQERGYAEGRNLVWGFRFTDGSLDQLARASSSAIPAKKATTSIPIVFVAVYAPVELVPTLKRVAMLSHPPHPTNAMHLQGAAAAARVLGVELKAVPVAARTTLRPR